MNVLINSAVFRNIFNPYKYSEKIDFKGGHLVLRYTRRAKNKIQRRKTQLTAEMQIYFSCVVQKRLLFHEVYEHSSVPVNDKIAVALRAVQSDTCDPVYFANNHPVKKEFTSKGAGKMRAKELFLDYKNGDWVGRFTI